MQKLLEKDKKLRWRFNKIEKKYFVLNAIFKNNNFNELTRSNAFLELDNISKKNSKTSINSRCLGTVNKKKFNKLTNFSRYIFLRHIRHGLFSGVQKSAW